MRYTDLPALNIDMLELYRERFQQSLTELADASPNSRLAWNPGYNYHYYDDGRLLTAISDGGVFSRPHFCLPLGNLDAESLASQLGTLAEIFKESGFCCFCSMFVDELYKPVYEEAAERCGYFIEWDYNDDYSDYVYSAKNLRELKGRRFRAKRNHINSFIRDFPDVEFLPLAAPMRADILTVVEEWADEKSADVNNLRRSDYLPIKYLLEHMEELAVKGGVIRLGGRVQAFAIGSEFEDRAVIHFEKANPDFANLYPLINRYCMREIFPTVLEVNREEDMGIEGLRIAKQSYHPQKMLRKFRAYFMKDSCK